MRTKSTTTTTKQKQIDFMWHLYGQKFSVKEIAKIYDVSERKIHIALNSRLKSL